MKKCENEFLSITVDEKKGYFTLLEKESNVLWEQDPWEGTAGVLEIRDSRSKESMKLDLSSAKVTVFKLDETSLQLLFESDLKGRGEASMKASLHLDGDNMILSVEDPSLPEGWEVISLHWPLRQFSLRTHKDDGYLALPYGQGCLIPSTQFWAPPAEYWLTDDEFWGSGYVEFPASSLTMPWFGAKKGHSAFVAIIETPDDSSFGILANYHLQAGFNRKGERSPYPRIACVNPVWNASLGRLSYKRRVRYKFLPEGGYVEMAKEYREYVKKTGLFRSLRDKIRENPEVEKIIGAPYFWLYGGYPHYISCEPFKFKWSDIKKMAEDLHENVGVEKAFLMLMAGFKNHPPSEWPFDTEICGTVEELADAIKVAKDFGYVFGFYNNPISMQENAAAWDLDKLRRGRDGEIGSRWDRVCSSFILDYTKMTIPKEIEAVHQNGDYEDCITPPPLMECHDPKHPVTRTQDRENKIAVFKYIRSLGLVVGSEYMRDWCVSVCDYNSGGMYTTWGPLFLRIIKVPLFNLVYHDAIVGHWHPTEDYARGAIADFTDKCLLDMLYGNPPVFNVTFTQYEGWRERISYAYNVVARFSGEVGLDELLSHEFLSENYLVQRTRFSSGVVITVNMDRKPFKTKEGAIIPPQGYRIETKGKARVGRVLPPP